MTDTAFERAKGFSNGKILEMRNTLQGVAPSDSIVLTCGSFARREASPASDLDYFCIAERTTEQQSGWHANVASTLSGVVSKAAAADGAFNTILSRRCLVQNIGGNDDSNGNITRRMLILLEGEWLFNEAGLADVRHEILSRYIGEGMTDHQLALFLLNDIIRYYRTIAVDYEFKAFEAANPKPWGIRNIKLVFSRKLLYASGLFSVALTADRTRNAKIKILEELFQLPVIDRMIQICGRGPFSASLTSYERFLTALDDQATRDHLSSLTVDCRGDETFRELKNEGHHFTRELLKLFEATFEATHPIRRAVIF